MGDWVIGALINIVGSVAINFGTNLLKLGHDQVSITYLLLTYISTYLHQWFNSGLPYGTYHFPLNSY
jgi:hypothetical protein